MGTHVPHIVRRHFFLLIGLLTLGLFLLVAVLDKAGQSHASQALAGPMRVLIVPMYVVWMVFTMAEVAIVGPTGLPGLLGTVVSGVGLATGLAPYVLADYLLDRRRRAAQHRPTQ